MQKYIISYQSIFRKPVYHQGIDKVRKSKEIVNVYAEVITFTKSKAKVFYSLDEAERVSNLFKSITHIPSIIKK